MGIPTHYGDFPPRPVEGLLGQNRRAVSERRALGKARRRLHFPGIWRLQTAILSRAGDCHHSGRDISGCYSKALPIWIYGGDWWGCRWRCRPCERLDLEDNGKTSKRGRYEDKGDVYIAAD